MDGTGTTAITELDGDATASLVNVNSNTVTIGVAENVTFTGTFPNQTTATTTVANGKTLTLTAAKADGETMAGGGTTAITELDGDATAALANVNSTTVTIGVADNVEFTGTLPSSGTTTVADTKILTISAAKAHGRTIAGDGTTAITALNGDADANLANVNSATVTIAVPESVEFIGTFPNTTTATTTVANGKTLTIAAAKANGETIQGNGNVTITALSDVSEQDLTAITASGTVSITVTESPVSADDFATLIGYNKTINMDSAAISGTVAHLINAKINYTINNKTLTATDNSITGGQMTNMIDEMTTNAKVTAIAFTGGGTITGNASQLSDTNVTITNNPAVTVTVVANNNPTVQQANLIDAKTTGIVTATVEDNVDNFATTLNNANNNNTYAMNIITTTSSTTAKIIAAENAQSATGDGNYTAKTLNFSNITTITSDTATNLAAFNPSDYNGFVKNSLIFNVPGNNVTFTQMSTMANRNTGAEGTGNEYLVTNGLKYTTRVANAGAKDDIFDIGNNDNQFKTNVAILFNKWDNDLFAFTNSQALNVTQVTQLTSLNGLNTQQSTNYTLA
jgi:hypothetical protein